ncbi:MAG: nitrate- and nitrite sensing domain-containing protein, partial [Thiotrichaceae bacterium]|nr:nitrate- and nitrite sensing domain-containing protein [Thiotrichaceae bacterium]
MFKHYSIHSKLVLLGIVSIVLIFAYAIKLSLYELEQYESSKRSIDVVELSVYLSNVLHELQKERGASAGYLGSKGKKFIEKLHQQRELTNERLTLLKDHISSEDNLFTRSASNNIDFSKLDSMRSSVDSQSVATKAAVGYYTALNKSILDTITEFSTLSRDPKIRNMLNSLVLFISAKERAGIERAILSATFARDEFTPFLNSKFLSVMAQQSALFNLFEHSANEQFKQSYLSIKSDASFAEVQRMRDIALSRQKSFETDPGYWFKTITEKINNLKKMEDVITNSVKVTALEIKTSSFWVLTVVFVISALALLMTFLLSRGINSVIMSKIQNFKDLLEQVKDGDLSAQFSMSKNSNNEMDQIGCQFQSLITIMQDLTTQISTSVHFAAKGDFKSCELKDEGFSGDFFKAIQSVQSGINAMQVAHDKQELIRFTAELRKINNIGGSISFIQSEISA